VLGLGEWVGFEKEEEQCVQKQGGGHGRRPGTGPAGLNPQERVWWCVWGWGGGGHAAGCHGGTEARITNSSAPGSSLTRSQGDSGESSHHHVNGGTLGTVRSSGRG
jgi:hypothetical protein